MVNALYNLMKNLAFVIQGTDIVELTFHIFILSLRVDMYEVLYWRHLKTRIALIYIAP